MALPCAIRTTIINIFFMKPVTVPCVKCVNYTEFGKRMKILNCGKIPLYLVIEHERR